MERDDRMAGCNQYAFGSEVRFYSLCKLSNLKKKFKSFVNDFTEKLQEKKCLIVVDNKVVSNSVLSVLYHDVQALFDKDTNEIADKMICPVTLFFWSPLSAARFIFSYW